MTKEESDIQEDPKQLERDIAHLREWLTKQPHIHGRTDDAFLLRYLRGCKYSLERAKEKIDTFYTIKTALPEFFSNRDTTDPLMQEIFSYGYILPLGIDKKGRQVVVARGGPWDPIQVPVVLGVKVDLLLSEGIFETQGIEIARGLVIIVDLKGMTISQVAHVSPAVLKKVLIIYQNAYPIRPKEIHFLNMQPALQTFLSIALSFLKEKIKRRVVFHKKMESLHEVLPKEVLPEEYDGSAGPIQDMIDKWRQRMAEMGDLFLKDDQYGVDESKRPGKPKTHGDLFGIEGSFRQLSVD